MQRPIRGRSRLGRSESKVARQPQPEDAYVALEGEDQQLLIGRDGKLLLGEPQ